MTAAWPGGLSTKKFSVTGYNEQPIVEPAMRTNMDSGPPKARARFTTVPKQIDGVIDTLTSAEVDTLITFFETTCAMGSLYFTWTHPRTGSAVTFMWLKYPTISPSGSPIIFIATLSLLIVG